MKIYSALWSDFHPLNVFFPQAECVTVETPADFSGPGILIVHGGEDISPALYNKGRSSFTNASNTPSRRDAAEWALMKEAVKQNIKIFGICRGAQMLCALAGGFLIQHVSDHVGSHMVETANSGDIKVNSLHHQMQYPFDIEHKMLAWSVGISKCYYDVNKNISVPLEPEAVYYPQIKGLALQWHPEMMSATSESNFWVQGLYNDQIV